eukprot:SAG31_NODE_4031_length_3649_cov_2.144225_3_plen_203_part_00
MKYFIVWKLAMRPTAWCGTVTFGKKARSQMKSQVQRLCSSATIATIAYDTRLATTRLVAKSCFSTRPGPWKAWCHSFKNGSTGEPYSVCAILASLGTAGIAFQVRNRRESGRSVTCDVFMGEVLHALGIVPPNTHKFSYHSLRHGAASSLKAINVADSKIMWLLNWATMAVAYKTYIDSLCPATAACFWFFGDAWNEDLPPN